MNFSSLRKSTQTSMKRGARSIREPKRRVRRLPLSGSVVTMKLYI